MTLTKPFTVTTTIVTTVDPMKDPEVDMLTHKVSVDVDEEVSIPDHLIYGVSQAACEHTMEHLMEFGIGVEGEIVETAPSSGRCPVGNLYQIHTKRCGPGCDYYEDVIDVEFEETA